MICPCTTETGSLLLDSLMAAALIAACSFLLAAGSTLCQTADRRDSVLLRQMETVSIHRMEVYYGQEK